MGGTSVSDVFGDIERVEVAVIEGSDSDDKVITGSRMEEIFKAVGLRYRISIASAHRHASQDQLPAYLQACMNSGTRHFVGIAGMAAVLPGIIAANLPNAIVYGVPVPNEKDPIRDLAALLAMIESPPGTVVRVCGRGSVGLTNVALAIVQDFWTDRNRHIPNDNISKYVELRAALKAEKPLVLDHTPKAG